MKTYPLKNAGFGQLNEKMMSYKAKAAGLAEKDQLAVDASDRLFPQNPQYPEKQEICSMVVSPPTQHTEGRDPDDGFQPHINSQSRDLDRMDKNMPSPTRDVFGEETPILGILSKEVKGVDGESKNIKKQVSFNLPENPKSKLHPLQEKALDRLNRISLALIIENERRKQKERENSSKVQNANEERKEKELFANDSSDESSDSGDEAERNGVDWNDLLGQGKEVEATRKLNLFETEDLVQQDVKSQMDPAAATSAVVLPVSTDPFENTIDATLSRCKQEKGFSEEKTDSFINPDLDVELTVEQYLNDEIAASTNVTHEDFCEDPFSQQALEPDIGPTLVENRFDEHPPLRYAIRKDNREGAGEDFQSSETTSTSFTNLFPPVPVNEEEKNELQGALTDDDISLVEIAATRDARLFRRASSSSVEALVMAALNSQDPQETEEEAEKATSIKKEKTSRPRKSLGRRFRKWMPWTKARNSSSRELSCIPETVQETAAQDNYRAEVSEVVPQAESSPDTIRNYLITVSTTNGSGCSNDNISVAWSGQELIEEHGVAEFGTSTTPFPKDIQKMTENEIISVPELNTPRHSFGADQGTGSGLNEQDLQERRVELENDEEGASPVLRLEVEPRDDRDKEGRLAEVEAGEVEDTNEAIEDSGPPRKPENTGESMALRFRPNRGLSDDCYTKDANGSVCDFEDESVSEDDHSTEDEEEDDPSQDLSVGVYEFRREGPFRFMGEEVRALITSPGDQTA